MRRSLFVAAVLSAISCWAQTQDSRKWNDLLSQKQVEEARKLCTGWLSSPDTARQVEAYKCLANVALCGQAGVRLEAGDAGGGVIRSGYPDEVVDEALGYLRTALQLAPQDLSIHKGLLYVLESAGRYDDMAAALDASCRTYQGKEGVTAWIPYTFELAESEQYNASIQILQVLLKHFPDSHDVIGNIGAMYMRLKKDDEALPYLRKAAELAPEDGIDNWNLARLYDFMGKIKDADAGYQRALKLKWEDSADLENSRCLYAEFVDTKLKDRARACKLERAACPADRQTACGKRK